MTKLKKKVTKKAAAKKVKKAPKAAPKNHNNPPEEIEEETPATARPVDTGGIAGKQLLQFINRVERLEEEKKGLADDIKDIYAEAKSTGFQVKIIRKVIALRKMDATDREEQAALIDVYTHAIGDAE